MSALDQNWYGMNGLRSYPIDDAATCIDDAGGRMPAGVLVDCSIRFPEHLGTTAFVSGVTITPTLATITFEIAKNPVRPSVLAVAEPESFAPLGSVAVPLPAAIGVLVPIVPAVAGAGGWVTLGPGVARPYKGRFSTAAQAGLLARCARGSRALPFERVGALNNTASLDGLVRLVGDGDLQLYATYDQPPGEDEDVLVFMTNLKAAQGRNVRKQYSGPCAGRPESGTCSPPAVEAINDVAPDPDGNIQIVFSSAGVAEYHLPGAAGGIVLDVPITLAEMCPPGADDAADPDTGLPVPPGYDACGDHIYFSVDDPGLTVVAGMFESSTAGYRAQTGSGPAAAVRTRPAPPKLITARFTLADAIGVGGVSNGGVVFGCTAVGGAKYYMALGDIGSRTLRVLRFEGAAPPTTVASVPLAAGPAVGGPGPLQRTFGGGAEMRVEFGEPDAAGETRVVAQFTTVSGVGRLAVKLAGAEGAYGVGAFQCYTLFKDLHAEDLASAN